MSTSVFLAELTWPEYRRRLREDDAIVLLPVGATEQHGPHLPMGCDALIPTEVCRRAAERVGGIVAPTLSYGYKSQPKTGGGNFFCGTTSLDGQTLSLTVRDVLKELARHGARKLAVIDGHYENEWFLTEGVDVAVRELRYDGIRDAKVLKMRYCERIRPETLARVFPNGFPGLELEHAAVLETSMMLHLRPDLVRLDRIPNHPAPDFPPYDLYPPQEDWVPETGVLSTVAGASAEHGRHLLEEFVDLVAGALTREFRDGAKAKPSGP
jgi:creatinine amidohydrolase